MCGSVHCVYISEIFAVQLQVIHTTLCKHFRHLLLVTPYLKIIKSVWDFIKTQKRLGQPKEEESTDSSVKHIFCEVN